MISKVFNSYLIGGVFKTTPLSFSNQLTFCTNNNPRYEFHPLRSKIMDLNNLDDFNNFFKQRQTEFDTSCYSVASRTLARILLDAKLNYNNYHRDILKNYLSQLQKIDFEKITITEFSHLLFLLRTIKLDQNNNNTWIYNFSKNILQKSQKKLKQIEQQCPLNKLTYFYQELSGLNSRHAYHIAKRINEILRKGQPEVESVNLSVSEILILLKGMKSKNQMSSEELFLLKAIVRTVNEKYLENVSFLELAQISGNLNEILSKNPNDVVSLRQSEDIHKRVLSNIDEMDEKSIMFILNSKKTGNKTYNQIYKIIFDKIFDQIQPNGESSFNELFTLRLFNGICGKIRLAYTTEQNQEKFFAFLRQVVIKTPRYINSFVETFIEKNFFNYNQLKKIVEIMESLPVETNFRLTLLSELASRRVDIEKLIHIDQLTLPQVRDKSLILFASIIESIIEKDSPKKQVFVEILNKFKERFNNLYKIQDQSFTKLLYLLDAKFFPALLRTFRKQIQTKFPNPFETEQTANYRQLYLKMLVLGSNESPFAKKDLYLIKKSIKPEDLEFILRYCINNRGLLVDHYPNILNLLSKNIQKIIASPNLLNNLERFLNSEVISIFEQSNSDIPQLRFWFILNEIQQKMSEKDFASNFSSLIFTIVKSNIYDFSYSEQYKSFLKKLIKNLDLLSKNVAHKVVKETLKLNLIRRDILQLITPKVRETLSKEQTLLLEMIEKNEFLLKDVELAKNNLHLFLFNLSPETREFFKTNSEKILSLIEKMKPRQTWRCILHYRAGNSKTEQAIIDALFKQLNKGYIQFQEYCPLLTLDVLKRNGMDKVIYQAENIKVFIKKALEYFSQKNRVNRFNLEEHVNLLRSANDFKIKNDDYIHTLLDRYSGENSMFCRELYLTAAQMGIEFNENEIKRLLSRNLFINFTSSFSKCFHLFLLVDSRLPNATQVLEKILNKYKQLSQNEKVPVYEIFYEYLKLVYPEQTKDFTPNNIFPADFCKNIDAINNHSAILLREVFEQVYQDTWVQNVIHSNYYYSFKNINLLFPSVSKYYGENNLIKKIMTKITGQQKFLIINRTQTSVYNMIKFIKTNAPEVVPAEFEEKLFKMLSELSQKKKISEQETATEQPIEQKKQE